MKDHLERLIAYPLGVIIILALVGSVVYGYTQIVSLSAQVASLNTQLASTTGQLQVTLDQKSVALSDMLYQQQQSVQAIQDRLGGFENTVGQITGTVNTLQKLSKTDPQLLQKYSKVFFLNENYVPQSLTQIPAQYVYTTKQEQIHTLALPHLQSMLTNATSSGVSIYVESAYRSFAEQKSLKSTYSVTYGAGTANQFSADQGYSEHQLGTAIDFTSPDLKGKLDGFDKTKAYQWLTDNAYLYGFILSYPKENTYYVFEPWHWRYVGVSLATYLHFQHLNFYSVEQRQIDDYLSNIFD